VSGIRDRRKVPQIPEGETGQVKRKKKNPEEEFFLTVFTLTAAAIDRTINVTIFVYVPAERF